MRILKRQMFKSLEVNIFIHIMPYIVLQNPQLNQNRVNTVRVESIYEMCADVNHLRRLSAPEGFFETKTRFLSSTSFPIHHPGAGRCIT